MKKFVVSLLLAAGVCVSGCIGPGLSGEMSREDAIRLYNGGVPEAAWLEELDTISRNLPMPDTKSVQLSDGFLFYKSAKKSGCPWMHPPFLDFRQKIIRRKRCTRSCR